MDCPKCGGLLRRMLDGGDVHRPVMACTCGYVAGTEKLAQPAKPQQGTTGQGSRKRGNPEALIVKEIQTTLEDLGLTVLRVGQWRSDFAGQTPGTPDLLISGARTPLWWAIEIKTPKGRLSPAQDALHSAGKTLVWRSVEDAVNWYEGEMLK